MTRSLESETRERARLNDAMDSCNLWSDTSEEGSEDDGATADNSTTIPRLSPTPIRVEIPSRFLPLLLAVKEATPATMPDARWIDVCKRLEDNPSYVLLGYHSFEEYLEAAITENMPVARNFDRQGNPIMVWTQLPYQWIQPNPTVVDRRNGKDNGTMLKKRSDEYKMSLKILHGQTNLTTEIVKAILHLERPDRPRIPMDLVAERLGDVHMLIVVRHVIKLLRGRGLLIDCNDRDYVWVLKDSNIIRSKVLKETFQKHLINRNTRKRAKELVEKDFWEEDPNIFLLFHTTNFAHLVHQAREKTDCVKMTSSGEVLWIE